MGAVLTFHTPLGLRGIRDDQRDPQLSRTCAQTASRNGAWSTRLRIRTTPRALGREKAGVTLALARLGVSGTRTRTGLLGARGLCGGDFFLHVGRFERLR